VKPLVFELIGMCQKEITGLKPNYNPIKIICHSKRWLMVEWSKPK
jgi:hypothetical protein